MPKTSVLASTLATAVLVTACGSSSPTTASNNTHASFLAQADAICKQVAAKRAATNKAVDAAATSRTQQLQVIARLAPAVVADEESAMTRLRALKPPSSLASSWSQLLTGMQTLTDDAAHISTSAKEGDLKAVETVTTSARKTRQQLTTVATAQGFHYCGRES